MTATKLNTRFETFLLMLAMISLITALIMSLSLYGGNTTLTDSSGHKAIHQVNSKKLNQ